MTKERVERDGIQFRTDFLLPSSAGFVPPEESLPGCSFELSFQCQKPCPWSDLRSEKNRRTRMGRSVTEEGSQRKMRIGKLGASTATKGKRIGKDEKKRQTEKKRMRTAWAGKRRMIRTRMKTRMESWKRRVCYHRLLSFPRVVSWTAVSCSRLGLGSASLVVAGNVDVRMRISKDLPASSDNLASLRPAGTRRAPLTGQLLQKNQNQQHLGNRWESNLLVCPHSSHLVKGQSVDGFSASPGHR